MGKPILTSVRGAYEPPYAEIIEFAVEGGFSYSDVDSDGYNNNDGTEKVSREDVADPWH